MTFFAAMLLIPLALGVGIAFGRRRGVIVGIAAAFGVLAAGEIGYLGLLVMVLPM